jgi:hypothetical protein
MNRETCNDYEIRCPKWKMLMHTVMVNSVKDWKIFNISQFNPGSSQDFSCCARIDIVWSSCPRKLCQVKHQITVTNHNSQSNLGSSRDLSCCDRIDIEWPHALMQMGQVRFNKSHAICSTSIVCKFVVEGEVFVKKEKINDEFASEGEDSGVVKIEDEFVFEAEKSDSVKEEKIKTVVDLNRQGVSDFPKPRVTRVGHNSDLVPVLLTNTTKVTSKAMSTWSYMDVDSELILNGYPWRFQSDSL